MRRHVRRHPHRDPRRAVDEEVREARGEHDGLPPGLVVVRLEIDRVRVDVAKHLSGKARKPRLCVPHRRRRVVVDRAEVALTVDQRIPHRERLSESRKRVVDGRVPVWVVPAHHGSDCRGGLLVRAVGLQAVLVHRVEDAAMDRFQPVADVGQRPPDDHTHRVVEIARAHLLLELSGLDAPRSQRLADDVRHRGTSPPARFAR